MTSKGSRSPSTTCRETRSRPPPNSACGLPTKWRASPRASGTSRTAALPSRTSCSDASSARSPVAATRREGRARAAFWQQAGPAPRCWPAPPQRWTHTASPCASRQASRRTAAPRTHGRSTTCCSTSSPPARKRCCSPPTSSSRKRVVRQTLPTTSSSFARTSLAETSSPSWPTARCCHA